MTRSQICPLVRLVSFISAHSSICRERRLGESWKALIKSRPPVECVGLGVIKNSTQGEFYSFDTKRRCGEQHWGCKSASLTGPENGKGHAMQKAPVWTFETSVLYSDIACTFLSTPRIEWARLAESLCEEKEAEERLESPICLEQEQRKGGFLLYSLYYLYQPSNNLISADLTTKWIVVVVFVPVVLFVLLIPASFRSKSQIICSRYSWSMFIFILKIYLNPIDRDSEHEHFFWIHSQYLVKYHLRFDPLYTYEWESIEDRTFRLCQLKQNVFPGLCRESISISGQDDHYLYSRTIYKRSAALDSLYWQ